MRQAGGARRRIRFGIEGILDLFGVDGTDPADLRRLQDALGVAGLGLEPALAEAAEGDSVQVWLASERLARDEPSDAAEAIAAQGGRRFEPAQGRRLDRRSARRSPPCCPGCCCR